MLLGPVVSRNHHVLPIKGSRNRVHTMMHITRIYAVNHLIQCTPDREIGWI